jgi:putative acetyltransferase
VLGRKDAKIAKDHIIGVISHDLPHRRMFLGCNTRLKNAIHLYESVGFRHAKPETLPPMPYSRADVFMEMPLE